MTERRLGLGLIFVALLVAASFWGGSAVTVHDNSGSILSASLAGVSFVGLLFVLLSGTEVER